MEMFDPLERKFKVEEPDFFGDATKEEEQY